MLGLIGSTRPEQYQWKENDERLLMYSDVGRSGSRLGSQVEFTPQVSHKVLSRMYAVLAVFVPLPSARHCL